MAYFTPSTAPHDPLAPQEAPEIVRARADLAREPYVANAHNAEWVGDRIAAVVQDPAPIWWWVLLFISAGLASFTGLGLLYLITTGVGVWGENKAANWAWASPTSSSGSASVTPGR
jgi:hypothetical protein